MKFICNAALSGMFVMSQISAGSLGLPEKPTTDLGGVVAHLKQTKQEYPHSALAQTQMELWFTQLSLAQLTELKSSIPSPWSATELSADAMQIRLEEMLTQVIETHPESIQKDHAASPREFGRRAGIVDWKEALKTADQIEDQKIKSLYLIGVIESAGQLNSFTQAETLRALILPKISRDQRHDIRSYEWTLLWPAESIAELAISSPDDKRFSLLRHVADNGDMFFSQMKEGEKYLQGTSKNSIF